LRYVGGATTTVYADTNGDFNADLAIYMLGVSSVAAVDFLL
jgi:hypothetical protein